MSDRAGRLQEFGLALQFMTRLPVPFEVSYAEEAQAASARFYPIVGLIVGAMGALALALGHWLFTPVIAAVLTCAVLIGVTGGLHEDGLADSADGLWGGATRERAMEIMRDSTVGVYGVLALILALALKIAVLVSLPLGTAMVGLVAAHGLSRYGCTWMIHRHGYARVESAKFAVPSMDDQGHRFARICAGTIAVALVILTGWAGAAAIAIGAGAAAAFGAFVVRKLGGYTGDTLGALQQVVEISVLLGLCLWL